MGSIALPGATGDELIISFAGPFSWPGTPDAPCVFEADEGRRAGIYLWTVPLEAGHLVYYVGETGRSFCARLREHYVEHAAAMYHVYSPQEFARGEKVLLWPGHYAAKGRKSEKECIENLARLSEHIRGMTYALRFLLAPLSCDGRIRRRAESAIARTLCAASGNVGAFQDSGIRYSPRTSDEEPISCLTSSSVPILGLPERFSA